MSKHIRNFSIIAHIDHGKSTLADRILDICKAVDDRTRKEQLLDRMDLEQERGITIKAQAVRLSYQARNGEMYQLNLIDTPGHVDFSYEVSRSLSACDGAILVVDASQSVEAQTMANVYLAVDNNLEIISVINKIDLPSADINRVRKDIEDLIGLPGDKAIPASAKNGDGIRDILEAVIHHLPPPQENKDAPLRAMIFDSWFDSYRGVIVLVRIVSGEIKKKDHIRMFRTGGEFEVQEVGAFVPDPQSLPVLSSGEVGFVVASIKNIKQAQIGDTIIDPQNPSTEPLPGFKESQPMVFAGIFPIESKNYKNLKEALEKLQLNDASFEFEPETSHALGFGFRCGFLGTLHMEIIQERLEREYNLDLIITAPTVIYHVYDKEGNKLRVDNPSKLPSPQKIAYIEEPFVKADIHVPNNYVGAIIKLCEERRGKQKNISYSTHDRVIITYGLPLAEVVYDFYDRLKSISRGYASVDYELDGYTRSDLLKLDILVNGEICDALSIIVHRSHAFERGQSLTTKLKEIIHRQMFEVAIQAAIGSRIISRTTVQAYRKNVTAKCYGGDISRKRKLLEKQKKGKKRMKSIGSIEIPQEAFLAILKVD